MNTVAAAERQDIVEQHKREVERGERFEFGKNWSAFLAHLSEDRIRKAEESLREMLETETLAGRTFLDIGSGSGLFSLAARRLGARVFSFDFDPNSVTCTRELKRRFFAGDDDWQIEQGSALDDEYVRSLGTFDIVYSWGVLHHTGDMWSGLENASLAVNSGGRLFIAIYNDTGSQARRWRWIKKTYCRLPGFLKTPFAALAIFPAEAKQFLSFTLRGRPFDYVRHWKNYRNDRGMSRWHDIIDWVGGYPYEVATVDEIFEFYKARGYTLQKIKTGGVGLGCNEFVFKKTAD
jgi:2-polyprenyl-3-methyl-5-hydroxy-6-metoxy-1,4-benzoquinol methylase